MHNLLASKCVFIPPELPLVKYSAYDPGNINIVCHSYYFIPTGALSLKCPYQ